MAVEAKAVTAAAKVETEAKVAMMGVAKAGMMAAYPGQRGEVVLGDIITAMGDQPIRSNSDFYDALENLSPDDTVTITTRRGGETRSFQVKVIESQ